MAANNYDDPNAPPEDSNAPPPQQHNYYNDAVGQLNGYYQKYLGRTPGNPTLEYGNHLKMAGYNGDPFHPFSVGSDIEQAIANGPEARAYASRPQTAPTTPTDLKSTSGAPVAPPMVDATGNVPPGYGYNAAKPWTGPDPSSTSFGSGFSSTLPHYTAQQIGQYKAPDFSDIYAPQLGRLKDILTNPVMDQGYVNNLNEQQKELALNRGEATQRASSLDAAHRGVSQGGYAAATARRNSNATTQDLLQSQRDVSNTAATSNRQGFLDALGMSNQVLGGDANIAQGNYASQLSGQQAQANEYGREYQSNLDRVQTQLQRDLAFEQLRQAGAAQGIDLTKFFNTLDFNYSGLNQQALANWLAQQGLNQ